MRRRWIADTFSPESGHPTHAALTGEQAVHLVRVLRAQPGEIFDVVAGGFLHRAEILTVDIDRVDFILHEELAADAALPLHLMLAIFKFDHLEWAIQKATELGVASITPIVARRTEKHLAQAATKRVERWRRIAFEAAQQSRRTDVPTIADPTGLREAFALVADGLHLLLSETEQQRSLADALRDVPPAASYTLAIGPEGGWTAEEMDLFTKNAWTHVTLGPRILRAETAAIAAIAITGSCLL